MATAEQWRRREDRAYRDGVTAFREGKDVTSGPYKSDTLKRCFYHGWNDAKDGKLKPA